ncbi:hypothetical protein E2C06_12845 [Dankookia rubra]|uniref:Uncharacterized protein n=1 Tax=Dankookia rubra TaxID=1442381 RepID=A0A4V3AA91_9PROT|nr:hypothetical protein [Dankookia rubra]TDH62265.1 hypothetical protein E2C06_12845 [Dankookia rubra]
MGNHYGWDKGNGHGHGGDKFSFDDITLTFTGGDGGSANGGAGGDGGDATGGNATVGDVYVDLGKAHIKLMDLPHSGDGDLTVTIEIGNATGGAATGGAGGDGGNGGVGGDGGAGADVHLFGV